MTIDVTAFPHQDGNTVSTIVADRASGEARIVDPGVRYLELRLDRQ